VRDRLARAARRAGRDPSAVRLVAVSKTFDADHVRAAAAAGQVEFGENRVQEALEKIAQTSDIPVRWHLVGHLQANKVRKAATAFAVIHSVDSLRLARAIDRIASSVGRVVPVLLEVLLSDEPTKQGIPPDELEQAAAEACLFPGLEIRGLMTVAPLAATGDLARPYFCRLRELRDRLARQHPGIVWDELSMGMTNDFEVAVEEGSTLVRIGRAIFGERG